MKNVGVSGNDPLRELRIDHGDWSLFKRSLGNHPGVLIGTLWPLWVFIAVASRSDFAALPWSRVALVVAAVGALPWLVILWTAWAKRRQHL